ncbi:exonuclease domain-containing protein [Corynebacterium mayonis]|uniref:exonuclease domain-containing protein n=1 Tax=Corynebacterium mayonis TaxID=3062461 RepID=UPI003140B601
MTASRGYAVVDLETTGFGHTDRIIEIGVVLLNMDLEVEGVWDTLIQPNRDIPNSHVHKVTASQLVHAPVFADVAPYLAGLLAGRVLVAHNATFENRFLTREFESAGVETNLRDIEWLDTMRLSQHYLGTSKLADSVAAARVENPRAHSALSDARATADLLRVLARSRGAALPRLKSFAARPVQAETPGAISRHRDTPQISQEQHWLARLAESLPASGAGGSERYRRALAASLVDHALSASEIKQLGDIAFIDGLSIDDINQTHEEFIRQLAVEAWLDGVVTDAERNLLTQLADDLGVSPELVAALLAEPVEGNSSRSFVLSGGDRIAFAGSLDLPREEWERRATRAGLVPGGVTKQTVVVVAANPDSMSGKVARARELMIPIVSEQSFARLVSQLEPRSTWKAPVEDIGLPSEDTTPGGFAGGDVDGRFAWVSQVGVGGDPGALTAETIAALWIEHKAAEPLYRVSPVLGPRYAIDFSRSSSERIAAQWSLRFERMLDATVHDLMDIPGVGAKRLQRLVEAVVLAAIDEDGTADTAHEEPDGFLDTDIYAADDSVEEPLDEIEVVKGWAALTGSPFPGSGEESISTLIKACLHELVDICIHDERSLAIASRRWLGEATLDELGAQFGVTRERIRQIEKQLRNVFDTKSQLSAETSALLAERLGPLVQVSAAQEELPALWQDNPILERSAEEYFRCMFKAW